MGFAEQYAAVVVDNAMADVGQVSAFHADGVNLGHVVGDGTKCRHGTEGRAAEVHVQSGDDDADAPIGQFVAYVGQSHVEELRFVDAHHVDVRRQEQDAGRRVDGRREDVVLVVTDHVLLGVAHVDGRLEYFHLLAGKLGSAQASDELFGLAREHGTADYFDAARAVWFTIDIVVHSAKLRKKSEKCRANREKFAAVVRYLPFFVNFASEMGILYIVPTPVGNMEDMTLRAIRILKEVDLVLAEDTRTSGILLKHFEIKNQLMSHHKFNEHGTSAGVVNRLLAGENVALISDAGTPGISDPGFFLVREAVRAGVEVQCLPGATAFVPALVSSGLPCDRFAFEGFLPQKKGRQTKIQSLADEERTMIFYESPYRLVKTLQQFAEAYGEDRQVSVCREISKVHEESVRGSLAEVITHFQEHEPKGEIVIVLAGREKGNGLTRTETDKNVSP